MSIYLEGVCAYYDLYVNSIIFEITWLLFFTICIYWIECYWQAVLFNDVASGSDILVASDVVGMGLNLNIRRINFSTLEKFDGTSMRALTVAEIKQIAGQLQYLYSYFKMPVAMVVFGLVAVASSTLE